MASENRSYGSDCLSIFNIYRLEMLATPHSRQRGLIRDVINPQDGHILCDLNPTACGFNLRIQATSRIVNNTISRPRAILVAFIEATLLGEHAWQTVLRPPVQAAG